MGKLAQARVSYQDFFGGGSRDFVISYHVYTFSSSHNQHVEADEAILD